MFYSAGSPCPDPGLGYEGLGREGTRRSMRGAAHCACVVSVASQARQLSCVLQQQRDCQTDRRSPATNLLCPATPPWGVTALLWASDISDLVIRPAGSVDLPQTHRLLTKHFTFKVIWILNWLSPLWDLIVFIRINVQTKHVNTYVNLLRDKGWGGMEVKEIWATSFQGYCQVLAASIKASIRHRLVSKVIRWNIFRDKHWWIIVESCHT